MTSAFRRYSGIVCRRAQKVNTRSHAFPSDAILALLHLTSYPLHFLVNLSLSHYHSTTTHPHLPRSTCASSASTPPPPCPSWLPCDGLTSTVCAYDWKRHRTPSNAVAAVYPNNDTRLHLSADTILHLHTTQYPLHVRTIRLKPDCHATYPFSHNQHAYCYLDSPAQLHPTILQYGRS